MLHDQTRSVAQIAEAVGYAAETAFRHAFKRSRGVGAERCGAPTAIVRARPTQPAR